MKLVGRDRELAELRDLCRQARDGRGRLVLVSGVAGIGKTALVTELAHEHVHSFDVTWGHAEARDDAPAYYPVTQCLKALGITAQGSRSDARTFALWEQVLGRLVSATARRPILWIIEDVDTADTQTLDLLCYLAQSTRGLPMLMIVTSRRADDARVARLGSLGHALSLGPLDSPTLAALSAARLGRELLGNEAALIAEMSRGIPLLAVEHVRGAQLTAHDTPPTLTSIVAHRLEQLTPGARKHVRDAAVLGDEVTAARLAAMRDAPAATVIEELAPAVTAGILEGVGHERYRFSHSLVREAIEAELPQATLVDAHARAERVLAAEPDAPLIATERARHALASLTPDREEHVLAAARHAIDTLEQQGACDRAAELCLKLSELRSQGRLAPATAGELIRGARVALACGRHMHARAMALTAADAATRAGDVPMYAAAALEIAACVPPGEVDRDVLLHLDEALRGLGDTPSPLRCRVMARLALGLHGAPDPQVPHAMARQAIDEARSFGDPTLLAQVLAVALPALVSTLDTEELRALEVEHLRIAREVDEPSQVLEAGVRLVLADAELADFAQFDQHLEDLLRNAHVIGHPRLIWRPLLLASMRAIARGQFADSERLIADVERAAALVDEPAIMVSLQAHRLLRALDLHRARTVADAFNDLEPLLVHEPEAIVDVPLLRALAAARLGDAARLDSALAGFTLDFALARNPAVSQLALLGEIYAAAGTKDQRTLLLSRLASHADRHVATGYTSLTYGGPVRRIIGLLELSLGNQQGGENHLRRALEICRALGFATWVARISFELGLHDEAARLAANLGIRGLARRADGSEGELMAPPTRPALGIGRDSGVWRLSYGVRVVRVPDSQGMRMIARLIERPGEELHAVVLAGDTLGEEGSITHHARTRVGEQVKEALVRIAQQDATVADYLRAAIRTGTFCTFRPYVMDVPASH